MMPKLPSREKILLVVVHHQIVVHVKMSGMFENTITPEPHLVVEERGAQRRGFHFFCQQHIWNSHYLLFLREQSAAQLFCSCDKGSVEWAAPPTPTARPRHMQPHPPWHSWQTFVPHRLYANCCRESALPVRSDCCCCQRTSTWRFCALLPGERICVCGGSAAQ